MKRNNLYGVDQGAAIPGQQTKGVDPDTLSPDEKESLRSLASSIVTKTEEYLPSQYWVDTQYQKQNGILSLGVAVGSENRSIVQCEIRPTGFKDGDQTEKDPAEKMNTLATDLSQQMAAAVAAQMIEMGKQGNVDQRGS